MSLASEVELLMLNLINQERTSRGLDPLAINGALNAASEDHSQWMLDTDTFSHQGEDGSSPTDRIKDADYALEGNWQTAENIGWQSERGAPGIADDVADIHESLMASPGHRANLLDPNLEDIGIGVEIGDFEGYDAVMVTQTFGTTDAVQEAPTPTPTPEPEPQPEPDGPIADADDDEDPMPTPDPDPVPDETPVADGGDPDAPDMPTEPPVDEETPIDVDMPGCPYDEEDPMPVGDDGAEDEDEATDDDAADDDAADDDAADDDAADDDADDDEADDGDDTDDTVEPITVTTGTVTNTVTTTSIEQEGADPITIVTDQTTEDETTGDLEDLFDFFGYDCGEAEEDPFEGGTLISFEGTITTSEGTQTFDDLASFDMMLSDLLEDFGAMGCGMDMAFV